MKKIAVIAAVSAGIFLLTLLLVFLTVTNLGGIIGSLGSLIGEEIADTFGSVFSALKSAKIGFHAVIPLVLCLAHAYISYRLLSAKKRHTAIFVIISVIILLISYISCLLLSHVNGIRFFDIISSLAKNLGNGLADAL